MTNDDDAPSTASFGLGYSAFLQHLSFVPFHSFFPLLQIFEKIRCKALASSHSSRASNFNSETARAGMRRKCLLSRASFLQVPMHFRNSFLETASSASS